MADLTPKRTTAADTNENDDVLSILNRETQEAVRRVAEQLHIPSVPRSGPEASSKYRLVCQAYEARRERAEIFDADLFADPAWDILLAMYREHLAHRPMTLSDALTAADVPHTTAMRWLAVLTNRGMVARGSSSDVMELTAEALEKLEAYMERLRTKSLMRVV